MKKTLRGLADYLLYGGMPEYDERDYDTRLDEAYDEFEKIALKYNPDAASDLLSSANEMTCENASVYLEIGMQAGMLLIADILKNVQGEQPEGDRYADRSAISGVMQEYMRKDMGITEEKSILEQFIQLRMSTVLEENLRQNKEFQESRQRVRENIKRLDRKDFTEEQWELIDEILSDNNAKMEEYGKAVYRQGMKAVARFLKELFL